jgi:hypothetical protein
MFLCCLIGTDPDPDRILNYFTICAPLLDRYWYWYFSIARGNIFLLFIALIRYQNQAYLMCFADPEELDCSPFFCAAMILDPGSIYF